MSFSKAIEQGIKPTFCALGSVAVGGLGQILRRVPFGFLGQRLLPIVEPVPGRVLDGVADPDVAGIGLLGLGRVPKHLGVDWVTEPDLLDGRCALGIILGHPRSTIVRQAFQRRAVGCLGERGHAPDSCSNRSSAASATARTRSSCARIH